MATRPDRFANILELSAFRAYWRDSEDYPDENAWNDRVFMPAHVRYEWGDGAFAVEFESTFRAFVAHADDGVIDIDETDEVSVDDFHLRLKPGFQSYAHDKRTHALIIEGSSDKMQGAYRIIVTPTIATPVMGRGSLISDQIRGGAACWRRLC